MKESSLLWWLFTLPAFFGIVDYFLAKTKPQTAGLPTILGALSASLIAAFIAIEVHAGSALTAWNGELYADGLSAVVVVIVCFVGTASSVFAYKYLRHEVEVGKYGVERLGLYYFLDSIFISTMAFATVTNNVIMLYVVVEATTLASALLVTFYGRSESLEAGHKYLILCSVGITVALMGCVMLYAAAAAVIPGEKALLITEIAKVSHQMPAHLVLIAGALVIIGFGTKAGLVPFHAWLPDAHSQAPSPVSALLSGVTIKVAAYALIRIVTICYAVNDALSLFLVLAGAVTMLFGIMAAFVQDDLKRMLAYSSVSQMGYIIMGLGVGTYLGIFGSIYHMMNHALLKSALFLCAGALLMTSGTTLISQLKEKHHHPFIAICFFIAAFGIGGLPPLSGFWSKFTIFTAAAEAHLWWAVGVAAFTSLLTLACLVRAGYRIFLEKDLHHSAEEEDHEEHKVPVLMQVVIVAMLMASTYLGLSPNGVNWFVDQASQAVVRLALGG